MFSCFWEGNKDDFDFEDKEIVELKFQASSHLRSFYISDDEKWQVLNFPPDLPPYDLCVELHFKHFNRKFQEKQCGA